jgi:hypothetical protein
MTLGVTFRLPQRRALAAHHSPPIQFPRKVSTQHTSVERRKP